MLSYNKPAVNQKNKTLQSIGNQKNNNVTKPNNSRNTINNLIENLSYSTKKKEVEKTQISAGSKVLTTDTSGPNSFRQFKLFDNTSFNSNTVSNQTSDSKKNYSLGLGELNSNKNNNKLNVFNLRIAIKDITNKSKQSAINKFEESERNKDSVERFITGIFILLLKLDFQEYSISKEEAKREAENKYKSPKSKLLK